MYRALNRIEATTPRARSNRFGFTLLEMMLSITIMLLVFGMVVPFFRAQLQAMGEQANRFDAQQNARFGVSSIERDLRVAGAGVPSKQPMVVQVDPYAVTFNADLVTNVISGIGSFGAVYFDSDMPTSATVSMLRTSKVTLPRTSVMYPDSNYYNQAGPLSYAETISYWVALDTTEGSEPGTYALYRRVNSLPQTIVARGLIIEAGDPSPFQYFVLNDKGEQEMIPGNRLPAVHTAIHGSATDINGSALTDSVRLVKIFLKGQAVGARGKLIKREFESSIRLLNAGLLQHSTCGEAPVFSQTVTASYSSATKSVTVTWNRAVDEGSGERDVERYVVFRRLQSETIFQNPHTSVAAGETLYAFQDGALSSGNWVYGVAAQDCGGQYSPVALSNVVTVP